MSKSDNIAALLRILDEMEQPPGRHMIARERLSAPDDMLRLTAILPEKESNDSSYNIPVKFFEVLSDA
jgi:hypothetical protein